MVKRMEGVSFTPSTSQVDARWAAARAKKTQMLRSTDWTQLRDVYHTLTPEARLQWDTWRKTIRSLTAAQFKTPEEFEHALTTFASRIPSATVEDFAHSNTTPLPTVDVVPVSEEPPVHEVIMRSSAIVIMRIADNLGINPLTLADRVSEASDAQVEMMDDGPFDQRRFPYAHMIAEATQQPFTQVVEETLTLYSRWMGLAAFVEALTQKALKDVRDAEAEDVQTILGEFEAALTQAVTASR